jgi:hypothetical protein
VGQHNKDSTYIEASANFLWIAMTALGQFIPTDRLLLADYRLTGVARALVTTAVTTVDSMSSVTSVSSLVSAVMVATAVVSV